MDVEMLYPCPVSLMLPLPRTLRPKEMLQLFQNRWCQSIPYDALLLCIWVAWIDCKDSQRSPSDVRIHHFLPLLGHSWPAIWRGRCHRDMRRLRHQEVIPIKSSFTLRVSRFVCSRRTWGRIVTSSWLWSRNLNPLLRISRYFLWRRNPLWVPVSRTNPMQLQKRRRRSLVKFSIWVAWCVEIRRFCTGQAVLLVYAATLMKSATTRMICLRD